MKKLLPMGLLASLPAYALDNAAASEPAIETASPVVVVLFLLVFAGCIGYYIWLTVKNDKKRKEDLQRLG